MVYKLHLFGLGICCEFNSTVGWRRLFYFTDIWSKVGTSDGCILHVDRRRTIPWADTHLRIDGPCCESSRYRRQSQVRRNGSFRPPSPLIGTSFRHAWRRIFRASLLWGGAGFPNVFPVESKFWDEIKTGCGTCTSGSWGWTPHWIDQSS